MTYHQLTQEERYAITAQLMCGRSQAQIARLLDRDRSTDMALVARLLRKKWSAEQIAGKLKDRGRLRISHETIYRLIRWDKRVGGDLWRHARIMSKFGRKRYRNHDLEAYYPASARSASVRLQ